MNRSYFKWVVVLAILCMAIVFLFMRNTSPSNKNVKFIETVQRPKVPYTSYISAVGIVEASGGNVFIGSPVDRVVSKIEVSVGQKVEQGQVLFRLDAEDLKADLINRNIEYQKAIADLNKLESLPRKEDVIAADAQFKSATVELMQAKSQYDRVEGLQYNGAMSKEEVARRKFAYEEAQAKMKETEANLNKIKAGAWAPDLEIARLHVKQARALLQRIEADIERTIIRAPMNATVLQIKIHEGEFPPSDSSRNPPMIIGNTDTMNLRVSINQFNASYFKPEAPAVAFLQGNSSISFPLKFVQIEPYFVPKQNLNNDITEKVDTRVLQVIYCFEEDEKRVFVGQQMDVFIETPFIKQGN